MKVRSTYSNGRVTLAILATKLDAQTEAIQELIGEFKLHVEKDKEIELWVDRLRETDRSRTWHIRAVWLALLAGGITWILRFF